MLLVTLPLPVHDENLDGAVSKQELFRFFLASLRVSVNDNIEQSASWLGTWLPCGWHVACWPCLIAFTRLTASVVLGVAWRGAAVSVNFVDSVFGMLDKDNNGVIKLDDAQAYLDAHPGVSHRARGRGVSGSQHLTR